MVHLQRVVSMLFERSLPRRRPFVVVEVLAQREPPISMQFCEYVVVVVIGIPAAYHRMLLGAWI